MLNFYDSIKQIFFPDGHDYVGFMYAAGKTVITRVFHLGDREFIWNKPMFIFTACFCGCALGIKNKPFIFLL